MQLSWLSADLLGVRENFITAGLPEATVQIIMSSRRTSTKNKYNIYLNKWIDYCSTRDIDPFNATIKDGLCFLTYIFECGNGHSSINSARSTLSAILPTCDGIPFGKQHLVSKFCRRVFQLRPSLPRYAFTWDTGKLLSYYRQIQENSELTLKQLTLKLATILALIMSQRAQTIHSLDINYMKIESDVITFAFPTLLKHSRPRHHLKPIPLKEYHVKKLCPVDLVNTYLDRTDPIRAGESKLLLSHRKPHKKVTQKTVSRWFKTSLKLAGINIDIFTGHSIRSAASSSARNCGAQITDILAVAGWSSERIFSKHYDKQILADNVIQDSVLP